MKQIIKNIVLICGAVLLSGCASWLDVVPDGVATLDNAFSNRTNAEKFFYGCYNMLPNQCDPFTYPGHLGGDDMWYQPNDESRSGSRIARNDQNSDDPFQNYWDGRRDGKSLWIGIRDCNIFLDNIHRVPDLETGERMRWIAEVKFIKAYLHYFLLQLYGPIPIVDTNFEVNDAPELLRVYREPVEDVIDYIVGLLDECIDENSGLPTKITETGEELGRTSRVIAAALKAKVLVWAASPLLNGGKSDGTDSGDYAGFKDKRGVQLIPTERDDSKWQDALDAIDEAIAMCRAEGYGLFEFSPGVVVMSDITKQKYTLRGAVSERPTEGSNIEIIWAHPANGSQNTFQQVCLPRLNSSWDQNNSLYIQRIGATMKMAETYYSKNGVPIDEDKEYDYGGRYDTKYNSDPNHSFYIKPSERTAVLNFDREPRFYAHLSFDRGLFEMLATAEASTVMINGLSGQAQGVQYSNGYITTGYYIKKLVSFRTVTSGTGQSYNRYTLPLIRMADLYLLRAEAANEVQAAPDNDGVWQWIDMVRERAGLNGVVESWANFANDPTAPRDKDKMREIIKRERLIELAFEGHRSFDLRRWKDAADYMNEPVQGWNINSPDPVEYYRVTTLFDQRNFTTKDYLWPLYTTAIIKNSNLVQNPGW